MSISSDFFYIRNNAMNCFGTANFHDGWLSQLQQCNDGLQCLCSATATCCSN